MYIDTEQLSNRQYYFLERVVEYVSQNGFITDKAIFQKSPFTDRGSIAELFGDEMNKWNAINNGISEINLNAGVEC
jgi:type I restriction enzyme R subunit